MELASPLMCLECSLGWKNELAMFGSVLELAWESISFFRSLGVSLLKQIRVWKSSYVLRKHRPKQDGPETSP